MLMQYYTQLMSRLNQFGPKQWLIGLGLVVVVGALCMRGFGSRSGY